MLPLTACLQFSFLASFPGELHRSHLSHAEKPFYTGQLLWTSNLGSLQPVTSLIQDGGTFIEEFSGLPLALGCLVSFVLAVASFDLMLAHAEYMLSGG